MRFVPLLTVCTVWLCCVLCRVPCRLCATTRVCRVRAVGPAHAVPLCSTVSYSAVLIPCCALCLLCCAQCLLCWRPMVGNGGEWQVPSQIGGLLPIVTTAGDQTKNHVVLHVEPPTRPYQYLCSRCETHWCVWLGAGSAYQVLPPDRSGCVPFSCSITNHYQPRC